MALEWVRPFGAVGRVGGGFSLCPCPDDLVVEYVGEVFDWRRCICGTNRSAAAQLSECDCWDGLVTEDVVSGAVDGGVLRIRHVGPELSPEVGSYLPSSVAVVRARILRRAGMPEVPEEFTFYRRWSECRGIAAAPEAGPS